MRCATLFARRGGPLVPSSGGDRLFPRLAATRQAPQPVANKPCVKIAKVGEMSRSGGNQEADENGLSPSTKWPLPTIRVPAFLQTRQSARSGSCCKTRLYGSSPSGLLEQPLESFVFWWGQGRREPRPGHEELF